MKKRLKDYAYDIDTVQVGQKIPVICSHENGCQRFLVMEVVYPSTMQLMHARYGPFDMRNQSWYCHSHKI